jgi:hypothetical protein
MKRKGGAQKKKKDSITHNQVSKFTNEVIKLEDKTLFNKFLYKLCHPRKKFQSKRIYLQRTKKYSRIPFNKK